MITPALRRKFSAVARSANGEDLNDLHPWRGGELFFPIHKWLERLSTTFPSSTEILVIPCSPLPDINILNVAKEETEIQTQIMEYLEEKGFVVMKFNNGAHKVNGGARGKPSKKSKGVSDLLACGKNGIFCAIEVKKPGGVLSKEQKEFLAKIKKLGGVAIAAFCLEDVSSAL